MKAIIENNNTYKITGERGDFFITEDNRGKIKMFAKHQSSVVDIEAMPKVKHFSPSRKAEKLNEKLAITAHTEGGFSGSFSSIEEKELFLQKREAAKWGSVSW